MQNDTSVFTFDQVLEAVSQWPIEQQEMLFDVLRQRQIAIRRQEIAQNVREARATYHQSKQLHTIRLSIEPNPDGVFTVTSPDVPGLVTEGSTSDEIWHNVQEALNALKDAWQALGKTPPPALRPVSSEQAQMVDMLVSV